nr:acyl-CoA dehydrogenase family protein [Micromonospora sp. DSM 115978]
MLLRDSESDAQFRKEVRAWLTEAVPRLGVAPPERDWTAKKDYDSRWQRMLYEAGYAGIDWPRESGGRGATPSEHLIFLEESVAAGAPEANVQFVGQLHAGPTLIAEATPEQRAFHLPKILTGESVWCQGFSEPGAGSDLANLRTKAVREGDHYVVSGQKIWTSYGPWADYCELLVRTDPDAPKHKGITWLIMPMDSP